MEYKGKGESVPTLKEGFLNVRTPYSHTLVWPRSAFEAAGLAWVFPGSKTVLLHLGGLFRSLQTLG